MQHGNISVQTFLPTNQDSAKSVKPTVGSFNDPSTRFVTDLTFDLLELFPSAANVNGKMELFGQVFHFLKIIAFIQTKILRFVCGGLRALRRNVF